MWLLSLLRILKYGSYKSSSRSKVYVKIADLFRVNPQHVYEIAHGKKPKSPLDVDIMNDLMSKGIIVSLDRHGQPKGEHSHQQGGQPGGQPSKDDADK